MSLVVAPVRTQSSGTRDRMQEYPLLKTAKSTFDQVDMDGTKRWVTRDDRKYRSSLSLTDTRLQHHWSTPVNMNLDSHMARSSADFAISDPYFTQQLDSTNTSPERDNSSHPNWPSATPTYTPQPASYSGRFDSTFYPTTTAWTSAGASAPNHRASGQTLENFMNSDFLKFEPIGASGSNLNHNSTTADRTIGFENHKPLENTIDFNAFDTDFNAFGRDGVGSDEHTIINLSQFPTSLDDHINLQATSYPRRQSSSSFVSSAGPMNDPPDASSYPEPLSYTSDYTPQGSLHVPSTPLSPVPSSPRCTAQDTVRATSRTRATPSPRPSMRSNPYSLDAVRNKQASTGSFMSSPAKRSSPYSYPVSDSYFPPQMSAQSQVTTNSIVNNVMPSSNLTPAMQHAAFSGIPRFHQPTMPPSTFDPASRIETVPYMLSNGTFRTLQSNAGPGGHAHDHFCDHADPPNLFGPLSEEQLVPPLEDMKPGDADLLPHEQELRFEGDLYTPRFVRGNGNKREGWCGICKPGRWLVLKNSAYWYDKSFSHGVSAASGQAFEGPRETRRMDGNADVWEGLCGSCGEWIALVSSKKKGTTWFRHAYKVCRAVDFAMISH